MVTAYKMVTADNADKSSTPKARFEKSGIVSQNRQTSGLFADASQVSDATTRHRIVIIDGHALAFRSYYAIRELTNSKGERTNAVYGFLRSLLRILQDEGERDATVVTFDAPAKTFRHEQYEDYKAGRAPMPEDLPGQIDTIKKLVTLLGLYQIEVPGLEADDLFGTIASKAASAGYSVEIVTSDRDAYQLVSEHICVRGLDKRDRFTPEDVFEKYGVRVDQWIDYRSLTGDASDNIPGAKGIGPVTAKKLLQRYDNLDYILEHLDEGHEEIVHAIAELLHVSVLVGGTFVAINGDALIDGSLLSLEDRFGDRFVRIHRSALVSRRHLRALFRDPDGHDRVEIDDCSIRPEVSRRNLPAVRQILRGR